jgi:uncharacterized membrane protein
MNIRRELAQIVIGALLLGLFMELGWLSPANNFFGNVATGAIIYVVSRVLALLFK